MKKYYFLLVSIFLILTVLIVVLFVGAKRSDEYFKLHENNDSVQGVSIGR